MAGGASVFGTQWKNCQPPQQGSDIVYKRRNIFFPVGVCNFNSVPDTVYKWLEVVPILSSCFNWFYGGYGICQIQKDSYFFQLHPRKARKLQHFWPKIDNGECIPHLFWTNFKFFLATIFWRTHSLQLFCENSSLNSANSTHRVIFRCASIS